MPIDFGYDILFSPRRNVIGSAAQDERIMIWLRDETAEQPEPNMNYQTQPAGSSQAAVHRMQLDITSPPSNSIVVLATRTGMLGTYKPVLVDNYTESSSNGLTSPGDGLFDFSSYYQNVYQNVGVNP